MNASELRIGNWVLVNETISTVSLITNTHVQLMGNAIVNNIEDIEPIPLTSEILEKAGFEKPHEYKHEYILDNEDIWRPFRMVLTIENRYAAPDVETYNGDMDWLFIDHLHHLQNFYFALTGKELIINL